MRRFQVLAAVSFAVIFSAWLGKADAHTDDTGVLVGLTGIGGFLLAIAEPSRPWIWGLLVPAGIILAEIVRGASGALGIAAFTIAVACVGAYLGAFVRRRMTPNA